MFILPSAISFLLWEIALSGEMLFEGNYLYPCQSFKYHHLLLKYQCTMVASERQWNYVIDGSVLHWGVD